MKKIIIHLITLVVLMVTAIGISIASQASGQMSVSVTVLPVANAPVKTNGASTNSSVPPVQAQ